MVHGTGMVVKGNSSPITTKGRREVAGFYARYVHESRDCDGGAYLLSLAVLSAPPRRSAAVHLPQLIMLRAESAQTLQVRLLRPVPKAAIHNECGMCAKFRTLA